MGAVSVMTAGMSGPHVLCVGGEDHHLRIPFLLELRGRGVRVSAAGTGDAAPFARAGIDYHGYQFDRFISPGKDRVSGRRLEEMLGQLKPDIVQSFDTKPNIMVPRAARRFPGIRVVRTINGMGWVYSSRSPAALALRPVQAGLHFMAGRSSDVTVFQNRRDQAFFERYRLVGPGGSVLVPGSGVDVEGFDRALASGQTEGQLRAAMDLGNAEVVITVTRLTRQKGIPALLKAAALVHRERPGVRFLLVGPRETEGPLAVSQREIERHAPYVIATGSRDDVPALLRMADVFAFPTEYREGVPRVLLEAALAGLPVISTDMPGCDDVIRDGWSGRLVPTRSPRQMAKAIIGALTSRADARAMAKRAAEHVREEFGLSLTVSRYHEVYRTVLNPLPASRIETTRLAAVQRI